MADASTGAQAGLCGHATHQLVGVKAAFHQHLAFGLVDQLHGLGSGRFAVGRIDDFQAADIDTMLGRSILDLQGWSDQDRRDKSGRRGLGRAP